MTPSPRAALAWSFLERYAGLMISIVSVMVLSRLLTPAQVGIYSLCAAFTAVAGILRDFGVSEYLIQEKDLTRDKLRSAYGLAIAIAWSIGAAVFLVRGGIADYFDESRVADVLAVLALNFALLPITSPTFALMNRELAFRQIFALQLASNSAQALVSVGLAYLGFGVMSLAWGPVANVTTQMVILMWMRPKDCLTLPGFREVRTVLRFGSMYVAARGIETLTRSLQDPVLAKQFGFESVGLFSRAFGLIDLFNTAVTSAVVRVATPAFAARYRAGNTLAEPYARATAIYVSLSWPFFGFIALMAEPIIRVMFGAQWVDAAPIAVVLAVGVMPNGLFALAPQMLSATGHVATRLKVVLWYCPVHIVGVLLAAQIGLLAVAAVWLVTGLFLLALYQKHLSAVLGVTMGALMRPSRNSAVVAAISVIAMAGAAFSLRWAGLPEWLSIPLVFAVGLGAWLLAVRLRGHPVFDELSIAWAARRRRGVKNVAD